jgi:parvulin-like peptidyl-prolyl isomerase
MARWFPQLDRRTDGGILARVSKNVLKLALVAGGWGIFCIGCEPSSAQQAAKRAPARPVVASAEAAPASDPVVATANGVPITMSQLTGPLLEGHGLNLLLNLAQFELVKQELAKTGATVTDADVSAELARTLARMFPDAEESDHANLLEQYLQRQRVSRPEFDLAIRLNASMRALIEPLVAEKVTEDNLQQAFRVLYGENVQVRHIQCANLAEIAQAQARLSAGEPFEKVARELSRNQRTGPFGGELPPFTRNSSGYPQAFRDAAFALQEGEVSEPVNADGAYHLIRLDRRIAPKAVKFEDVKESLREDLIERRIQAEMAEMRQVLQQQALALVRIEDPMLRRQFDQRRAEQDLQIRDRKDIRQQLAAERDLNAPTTGPTTTPWIERPPVFTPPPRRAPVPISGATTRNAATRSSTSPTPNPATRSAG